MDRLGLIAGNGKFPLILAENARMQGVEVVAVALREEADPAIEAVAARTHWFSIVQLGGIIDAFKKEGVKRAVMAGQVVKRRMYASDLLKLDLTAARLWAGLPDKRGETILRAIADELSKNGIELVDSTLYMGPYLAGKGVLTRRRPTEAEMADVAFGLRMAKVVAGNDIGQSVVVKGLSVVAVEAAEGTDNCITRARELCREGMVVVKVSRDGQDMRFDVPVVGLGTLDAMKKAGAKALAVEAGKTLMLEKEEFLAEADKAGISVLGV